jgi:hypothetical protein
MASLYSPGSRALGTNPRARSRNRWAVRNWKRKQRLAREAVERGVTGGVAGPQTKSVETGKP